jgi:ribose/xylose/arabinose/galactoside ABC-type transport system permease subunit
VNEDGAAAVAAYPDRFGLLASLPLPEISAALAEVGHAFDVLGADGIGLHTHYGPVYLSDARPPIGRHIVFVGANREVARLAGINVNRIRVGSYISASIVAALAGIMLVATVGGFDPTASPSYLLPALAAVFLGTAVVMPGQFNPIGTLFGIYFLETGIIGLQLLGYSGWVQDAFYGAGLVAAVTVAHLVRNRTRVA